MRILPMLLLAATLTCACSPSTSPAPDAAAAKPGTLQCKTGPAVRSVAGADWLVYACGDGRSVVLMTQEGHPSHPYYFMIMAGNGVPRVIGEGWDRAQATNAAWDELNKGLSPAFVATLHAEATAAAAAAAEADADESIQIQ
jgi:hypothetical protein